jgi:hypothetical protein
VGGDHPQGEDCAQRVDAVRPALMFGASKMACFITAVTTVPRNPSGA